MKVALYVRISTDDKGQHLDTQLLPLRQFCTDQGWTIYREYSDQVSAADLARRVEWRQLLDDASKRRFDLLLLWRMDRGFRSVLDASTTLERLRGWGVGLRSYSEPWLDTTSPFGEALYYITVAYAQLERGILSERVKAGMVKAQLKGSRSVDPGSQPSGPSARVFEKCCPSWMPERFPGARRPRSWASATPL
ncbi:MAG: recombinase family protein [Dehalococcoidia bacterium]